MNKPIPVYCKALADELIKRGYKCIAMVKNKYIPYKHVWFFDPIVKPLINEYIASKK